VAGVSINTVSKLLADAGKGCAVLDDVKVRGAKARRMEVDEIWSFVYAKQRNVATARRLASRRGCCSREHVKHV
jgi:hypothetical protein